MLTMPMNMDSHSAQVCRLEVVNTGRRRRWSFEEKLRIVEESFRGHRQASATARRHDISQSLLFRWRRSFRQGRLGMTGEEPDLIPAVITSDDEPDDDEDGQAGVGRMEIVIGDDRRVIVSWITSETRKPALYVVIKKVWSRRLAAASRSLFTSPGLRIVGKRAPSLARGMKKSVSLRPSVTR